jgi:hypothetical protein
VTDLFSWDILKWVLLVLLAGFIGQFGKAFAQSVMARMRRKREAAGAPSVPAGLSGDAGADGSSPSPGPVEVDGRNGSEERSAGLPSSGAGPTDAAAGADKKSLKALAKQRKKETKLRSKHS